MRIKLNKFGRTLMVSMAITAIFEIIIGDPIWGYAIFALQVAFLLGSLSRQSTNTNTGYTGHGYSGYSGYKPTEPVAATEPVVITEPKQPKPKSRIKSLSLSNNITDYQHHITSKNQYGLTWEVDNNKIIYVRQKMDDDDTTFNWVTMGVFFNHSIIDVYWIKPEVTTEKTEK